jgi:hypothetical protein
MKNHEQVRALTKKLRCFSQGRINTCGLACLRAVFDFYGVKTTEKELERVFLGGGGKFKNWGLYASDLALLTMLMNENLMKDFDVCLLTKMKRVRGPVSKLKSYSDKYRLQVFENMHNICDKLSYYLFTESIPVICRVKLSKFYKRTIIGRGHFVVAYPENKQVRFCDPFHAFIQSSDADEILLFKRRHALNWEEWTTTLLVLKPA